MAILEARELKKYFGNVKAVDGVNLSLESGEVKCILGPNGAGKTTLINLISGFIKPDSGKLILLQEDITSLSARKRVKKGIVRSFQIPRIFPELSVAENVIVPLLSTMGKVWNMYYQIKKESPLYMEALNILRDVGMEKLADFPARNLSAGYKKLLDVSICLALKPKVLLLDEPTSGVSTQEKHHVMQRIISILKSKKIGALIIEHDISVALRYSDHLYIMHEGKIIGEGTPEEIKSNIQFSTYLFGVP